MDDAHTLEKLGNHRYRLTLKWDGTEKNYEYLQRNNFKYLEGNIYFVEFEMESELFNYGVSMSECYQTLFQNGHFSDDFIRLSWIQPVNARMMKEAEGSVPLSNFMETLINMTGVDNFMFFIAKNYDSALAKEAERQYGDVDKDSFLAWLIEKITPRFSGNVTRESMASYFIADDWIKEASNINWPYSFFSAWEFVADHKEEYSAWRESVSNQDGIDINVISSLLNNISSEYTQYFQFYFFTEDFSARRLFQMRNSSSVDYNTKKLIQDVLVDYCKDDSEFAETIQRFYSEYRLIAGEGVDINFVPTAFENDPFVFPKEDMKKNLSEDLYGEDKDDSSPDLEKKANNTNRWRLQKYLSRPVQPSKEGQWHCQGIKESIVKKGDYALTKFIQGIADRGYIDDDKITKNSFAYALTGRGNFKTEIIKVRWHHSEAEKGIAESVRVLLYISKYMFDNTTGETYTQLFKVLNAGINPYIKDESDQSPSYADHVSDDFKTFFISCFEKKTNNPISKS